MKAHIFALHCMQLPIEERAVVSDAELVRRIRDILRLEVGEQLDLFDGREVARVKLLKLSKNALEVQVLERQDTQPLSPEIIWILPLIEREQWEDALYSLAAAGATTMVPVKMAQSRAKWGAEKDYERARRVMIAACEQAKQFVIPELTQVQEFQTALAAYAQHAQKIYFDAPGKPLKDFLPRLSREALVCASGPEGGFVDDEIALLREHGFTACALTPTILKASHAVALGVGLLRAWLR